MSDASGPPLSRVAMVANSFGDGPQIPAILDDWFRFLGGKPGQVVFCDNGADEETQRILTGLALDGKVDKLVLVRPGHYDGGLHQVYIAEQAVPAMADRDYLLFFHIDTLPYREGHDDWLDRALGHLDRDDTFAVGGSFNGPAKLRDAWPGAYFSHKCSENFALMKRSSYRAAVDEVMGDYLRSGYRAENPARAVPGRDRFLLEWVFERWMEAHRRSTLTPAEDPTWSVFHTNTHGALLAETRARYYRREGIGPFLDSGNADPKGRDFPPVRYYGQPAPFGLIKRIRIAIGASPLGPIYRAILGKGRAGPPAPPGPDSGPLPVERQPETLRPAGPHRALSLVLRWSTSGSGLGAALDRVFDGLPGRPRQVVLLVDLEDPGLEEAWDAYRAGRVDKLVLLRGMDRGALTPRFLAENGILSLAFEPSFGWAEVGEVPPAPTDPGAFLGLAGRLEAGEILAAIAPGDQGFWIRRSELIALLDATYSAHATSGRPGPAPREDEPLAGLLRGRADAIGRPVVDS